MLNIVVTYGSCQEQKEPEILTRTPILSIMFQARLS